MVGTGPEGFCRHGIHRNESHHSQCFETSTEIAGGGQLQHYCPLLQQQQGGQYEPDGEWKGAEDGFRANRKDTMAGNCCEGNVECWYEHDDTPECRRNLHVY